MHSRVLLSCLPILLAAMLIGCSKPAVEADYVFQHVNVVPMTEEVILPDRVVAVREGEIIAILEEGDGTRFSGAEVIDGGGAYLMPGLYDMHVHLRMAPEAFFGLQLANGVTTVHNMGDADGGFDHIALRADIAEGRITGPRYLISGPQLHEEQLPDLEAVAAVLEQHAARGYDTMKVHGNLPPEIYTALMDGARQRGFRVTGHTQQLVPLSESLRMDAIEHVEEFLYVAQDPAHGEAAAGGLEDYLAAYYANAQALKDPAQRKAVVDEVAASGIYLDATLIIYSYIAKYLDDDAFAALATDDRLAYLPRAVRAEELDPERNEYRARLFPVFAGMLEAVGSEETPLEHINGNVDILKALMLELHDAGVPLMLGSDAFGLLVPGFAAQQELELMVEAGLTPYEALRTGTVNPAAYLGESDIAGTIETGKRADFILVRDNPLTDIRNAGKVHGVYVQGSWYSRQDLDAMLERARVLAEEG